MAFSKKKGKFSIKHEKRKYWHESQSELERLTGEDSREFWKKIGRTGVGEERKKNIQMEIYNGKGEIIRDKQQVLSKWQNDFKELLNPVESMERDIVDTVNLDEENNYCLNSHISSLEVTDAMKAMKRNRVFGIDRLPAEVLKSSCLTKLLTALFNKRFSTGIMPDVWKYGII